VTRPPEKGVTNWECEQRACLRPITRSEPTNLPTPHQLEETMRFCTAINCMDGRVQLPVIQYLQKRFNVDFVDSVTEAGPNLILSEARNNNSTQSILSRVNISVEHHDSVGIAVVGHHSCAGNPASRDEQGVHTLNAVQLLRQQYENMEVTGLWVDSHWDVHEVG